MGAESKQIALVLCHTFFHTAFRSEKFGKIDMAKFKKYVKSRFLADFIIDRGSESNDGEYFAFTSKKIFEEFSSQLKTETKNSEIPEYLKILRTVIRIVKQEQINKLNKNEGIIVIGDTISNLTSYEPLIVTEMKDKTIKFAIDWYKNEGIEKPDIPFSILDLDEVLLYLKETYPEQYASVKERDPLFLNNTFL